MNETNSDTTLPYKFTSKELDSETGLYYYGWRYLDPKTGTWCSSDPALAEYLPTGDKEKDKKLPGEGGVFKSVNIDLYHYAGNNPIRYVDADGRALYSIALKGGSINVFGHALLLHVDDQTGKEIYYEVTGPNASTVNVFARTKGEFISHYGDRLTKGATVTNFDSTKSSEGYDVVKVEGVDEKKVLARVKGQLNTFGKGKALYPYTKMDNNCARFVYDNLRAGGAEPVTDPSDIGENPTRYPRDLNQAIRFRNRNIQAQSTPSKSGGR